jgi:hypothetical protein
LHVYGQATWHDEVTICGDRLSLTRLRDAIDVALGSRKSTIEVWVADGEGYSLHVIKHDDGEEDWDSWNKVALPYSANHAADTREDAIYPQ